MKPAEMLYQREDGGRSLTVERVWSNYGTPLIVCGAVFEPGAKPYLWMECEDHPAAARVKQAVGLA